MIAFEHLERPLVVLSALLLLQRYTALRRVRGDGNCFYRSFLFGYLEQLLQGIRARGETETKAMLELSRVRQVVYDRYMLYCITPSYRPLCNQVMGAVHYGATALDYSTILCC